MLCAATQALFSQQDSLLKKFRYRIDHYRAIGLNLGSSGGYNESSLVFGTNKSSNFSGNGSAYYGSLKSTDRILLSSNAGLGLSFNTSKSTSASDEYKSTGFSLVPRISVLNKWFSKKIFTELGAELSGNIYSDNNTPANSAATGKNKQQNYSIAVTAGIGKGRLENITDMQNALWLYKELQAEKSIHGNLSADELLDLGRSITRGNNTRVLDARKRTRFILETIDAYLQQKGLVTNTDMRYFSSLNDIVFFAINNQRLAGTEKFIRITPGIASWNDDITQSDGINKYERRFTKQSVMLSAGLNKYIPVDLVHQNNYGAALKLSYITTDFTQRFLMHDTVSSENKGKPSFKQAGVNLFFEHAIYPNTRTIISINLQSETGYEEVDGLTGFYGAANLLGSMSYFISYQARLTGSLGATYRNSMYETTQFITRQSNNFQMNVSAGIEISL